MTELNCWLVYCNVPKEKGEMIELITEFASAKLLWHDQNHIHLYTDLKKKKKEHSLKSFQLCPTL